MNKDFRSKMLTTLNFKRIFAWGFVAAISVSLSAFQAAAQSPGSDDFVAVDGRCPSNADRESTKFRNDVAYSLIANLDLREGPDKNAETIGKSGFGESLRALDVRNEIVLVEQDVDGDNRCGWADADFVLVGTRPLKSSDTTGSAQTISVGGKTIVNPLELKAIIRSDARVELDSNNYDATSVPFYDAPGGNVLGRSGIFGIFKVYKQAITRLESGEDQRWFFIGGERIGGNGASGWVLDRNLQLLDSRLSLYFSRSGEPMTIYSDFESVKTRDGSSVIATGRSENAESAVQNLPRYPIIDDFPLRSIGSRGTAYQVLFFGSACDDKGSCQSAEDTLEAIDAFSTLLESAANIDVLFVIDNTQSMSIYFPYVADAVAQAASEIVRQRGDEQGQVRFAAAVYGDTSGRYSEGFEYQLVSDFALPDNASNLNGLRSLSTFDADEMRDLPEAGLRAIVKAIDDVSWSPSSDNRVVFWIGDHGSRAFGNNEAGSVEQTAQALLEKRAGLVAINVTGKYDARWNETFLEQADSIISFNAADGRSSFGLSISTTDAAGDRAGGDAELAGEKVLQAISETFLAGETVRDLVRTARLNNVGSTKDAISSTAKRLQQELPTAELGNIETLVSGILESRGYDAAALDRVYRSRQLMEVGFVLDEFAKADVDFWVMIDPDAYDALEYLMGASCRALGGSDVAKALEDIFNQVVSVMSGDRYDKGTESISEFLTRTLFLPRAAMSAQLDKTASEIADLLNSTDPKLKAEQAAVRSTFCRSAALISLVEKDKIASIDSLTQEDDIGIKWSVGDQTRDYDWFWKSDSEVGLYYVPLEYFPMDVEALQ